MERGSNVHCTGLVLDDSGVLLRGPSGAGKSLLALELIDDAQLRGERAAIVADDRIDLRVTQGRLVMHAPASIAGLIELRGRGIVRRAHLSAAPVHLLVDMVDDLVRMVEEDQLVSELEGVRIARCPVPRRGVIDSTHQRLLVREALTALTSRRGGRAQREKSA